MSIMFPATPLDAGQREQLAEAYRHITAAHAIVHDLFRSGTDDLKWADACLIDAGGDVKGMFDNSEPMSFR